MTTAQIINVDGQVKAAELAKQSGGFAILNTELEQATGWSLKPEGLCREQVCVPVRDTKALSAGDQVDLVEFARVLNLNIVVDRARQIAALGEQAESRSNSMTTLDAPDFTLPDIHGRQVTFSDFNRRKRLLLAWSSW